MGKIKGWTKIRINVWIKDEPCEATLHKYVSIRGWNVYIADALRKHPNALKLLKESYVYKKTGSYKDAKKEAVKFMREKTGTGVRTNMDDLELNNLEHFSGSQGYINVMNANITEGIKYLMDNGYSWFVTDSIVNLTNNQLLRQEEFICIKLKINDKGSDEGEVKVTFDDGNDNILHTQNYEISDAKKELTLFYRNNVLMLASEY